MYVLDTSCVMEIIHGTEQAHRILDFVKDEFPSITAFTAYEILLGLNEHEKLKVEEFFNNAYFLNFDKNSSSKSAEIERHLKRSGKMINKVDIFIAGICMENGGMLISLNKDFEKIKGLECKIIEQ